MLICLADDPIIEKPDLLCLESFVHLVYVSISFIGNELKWEEDLPMIRAVLTSWQPKLSSRKLELGIYAEPSDGSRRHTEEEFLHLVGQIAEVVEKSCSGLFT